MDLVSQTKSAAPLLRVCQASSDCDEARLIVEAKAGSLTAFEQLVQRYELRVFRVAQSMAHCREDAEEIVQSAFVQAFSHLSRFRGDSRFYTWLVRIAINEGLMKRRRRCWNEISIDNAHETEEGIVPRELEDSRPTPEEHCSREEMRIILATTIGELPPHYRIVFQLRAVEGFSTKETARALDLSLTAVKTRLRRARVTLRNSLQPYARSLGFMRNQRSRRFSSSAAIGLSRARRELTKNKTVFESSPMELSKKGASWRFKSVAIVTVPALP